MAATTTAEQNKALIRRNFKEAINDKNYDVHAEVFASDFVSHGGPGREEGYTGRDIAEEYLRDMHEAFPDVTATIDDMVAEDDLVACRINYTATHKGELMGLPATGNKLSFDAMAFFRIEDGKIAESWLQLDDGAMKEQLGLAFPQILWTLPKLLVKKLLP